MSGSFSGFSEDDIRKLKVTDAKTQIATVEKKIAKKGGNNKHVTFKTDLRNKRVLNDKIQAAPVMEVPDEAKLIKSPPTEIQTDMENVQLVQLGGIKSDASEQENNLDKYEKKVINLDEFQAKQKLMEEQNRKRKELLVKALADRTKSTQEEVQRLEGIKAEFRKLDAVLSNDVKILRNQIEVASLEFMEAQKKYYRIEQEFLAAKLNLQQKLEKKEMLTEHLCTIIEKNEERKAEKLNDLLMKLELKSDAPTVGGETSVADNAVVTSSLEAEEKSETS